MRILLLGEYSNVHWTLAEGLRSFGHEVCVASNGDFWKNYRRDISLVRKTCSLVDSLKYSAKVAKALTKMRGYDIVQLINPMFLELKAERLMPIYKYLRRHNGKIFLGAFGMDHYWVNICRTTSTFRYSDFNFGNMLREDEIAMNEVRDWIGTAKERLNKYIAEDCEGIIAGLYEYYACYSQVYPQKTKFIPYPINTDEIRYVAPDLGNKVRFFIGISKNRSVYKGTDIMLRALERVCRKFPERCEMVKAEGVPYQQYRDMMNGCNVFLDQLYSYTPAMNGLLAIAKGLVLVGGGEEENYEILGEKEMRPIVNVLPDEDDVYNKLLNLVEHPEMIRKMSADSRKYIELYHDYKKVAATYLDYYQQQ